MIPPLRPWNELPALSLSTLSIGNGLPALNVRASNEGFPVSYISLGGGGQGCPLLRASNEHILIVRVLRARRAHGPSPLFF